MGLENIFQYLHYRGQKEFIKRYEANPKNYTKHTPPTLLANREYLEAVEYVQVYESLRELDKPKPNIATSVGTINLSTGKKTSLQQI
ncbi:MAG: hypothetical protein WC511_03835 [Candidatus Pacearchaeota archaeon]